MAKRMAPRSDWSMKAEAQLSGDTDWRRSVSRLCRMNQKIIAPANGPSTVAGPPRINAV